MGLALLETSTDLREWNELMSATLDPALETGTNANSVFSVHLGKTTFNLPVTGPRPIPSSFFRARLR
jgi:hypothetical protein